MELENQNFSYYLKKILSEYRRPQKEPKNPPSTDVNFQKLPIKYEHLESYLLSKRKNKVHNNLKTLTEEISNFFDGGNSKLVWETTLYLLKMFYNKKKPLLENHRDLEKILGPYEFSKTEFFFKTVKEFCDNFENDPIFKKLDLGNESENFETEIYYEQKMLPNLYKTDNSILKNISPAQIKKKEKILSRRLKILEDQKSNGQKNYENEKSIEFEGDHKKWILDLIKNYGTPNLEKHVDRFVNILSSTRDDLEIQEELVTFIGFENLTLAEILIKNRPKLKDILKISDNLKKEPALGPQVVVQTKHEKSLAKKLMKIQKKNNTTINHQEVDNLKQEYLEAKKAPLFKKSQAASSNLPNVYDVQKTKKFAQAPSSKVTSIPSNAIRKNTDFYEEFEIPAHEKKEMLPPDRLIRIDSLDRISQIIFNHIEKLNVIQSLVFPIAYGSNENMLICAPTGAGKTNTALLAITHQILQHTTEGVINLKDFKIVYVCPMKALSAEMTANFSRRLKPLGILVREVTGDMQVSPQELQETHMIVTTPEKWDIITRKGGTNNFVEIVKLLIIDEVHLLAGDRGPVIEALVARTLRQVESSQKMIRIVGLSATLPNYQDVAKFLRVNPHGLFFFDSRFRPVPLKQIFVGIKADRPLEVLGHLDTICFEKVQNFLKAGHQCMVFVHSRSQTWRTANFLKMEAQKNSLGHIFEPKNHPKFNLYKKKLEKSSNPLLSQLLAFGLGIHNAGMARTDRDIMEECFHEGIIRCLCTTATLAWGVNLPAHAVIIKGTELYSAAHGGFTDLDVLDVLQIFGRAGRPQFDSSGTAVIISKHEKMYHYLRTLTAQVAIESKFLECLVDNLNAEIVLGTVTNVEEGVEWLRYTYLYQRLLSNPFAYGVDINDVQDDATAKTVRTRFIQSAAKDLQKLNMIRYNPQNGDFSATTLGRIASVYYLKYGTVELFSEFRFNSDSCESLLDLIAHATEFKQIKTREDEFKDLDLLMNEHLVYNIPGYFGNDRAKINLLMQAYISRVKLFDPTLISEQAYIVQNVLRISRALFEIGILKNDAGMAERCLGIAKMFETQVWDWETPLRQFPNLPSYTLDKVENREIGIDQIFELEAKEISNILRERLENCQMLKRLAEHLPNFELSWKIQPITRTVIKVSLNIIPLFVWTSKYHGPASEHFILLIVDQNEILHSENFVLRKKQVISKTAIDLIFSLRFPEDPPSHFTVKILSERWFEYKKDYFISFRDLILPHRQLAPTKLLTLQPLPLSVLKNQKFQDLYKNFSHFNPIQTQVFFTLYNTDGNILIGAPTGSGKTIMSELAILRLINKNPGKKCVYVAPMKALVRERVNDWMKKFGSLGLKVIEVTGDVNPSPQEISSAFLIITTPEKWDSLSRGWQGRNYVRMVGLMIIDEIHLLGEERGPVLEVIVSRTNYIAAKTNFRVRLVGLSTSMANAADLAAWLGVRKAGLFNFRSSVRPVPIEVHMGGVSGKHYCPRMKAMNKPTYQSIRQFSEEKSTLVFVSSRRQTRLTAQDLVAFLASSENPRQWVKVPDDILAAVVESVKDPNLKNFLPFGIGTHHAGLEENDRKIVEKLFLEEKIQVLVATATLAWGVNFPAHLVVIKGTEYFDTKKRGYTDMPVTDILQMVGRAGRPQFDTFGIAVVLVHDIKKNFYKKFLYEPFPIESNLLSQLADHINAEISNNYCTNMVSIFEWLSWTFFYQRLKQSPSYYNLRSLDSDDLRFYLEGLINGTISTLIDAGCISFDVETGSFTSTYAGSIASYYYLSHKSVRLFNEALGRALSLKNLLLLLASTEEYKEFPVRHNEEHINEDLEFFCRMKPGTSYENPETKVFLLLQAHFSRLKMPIPDYKTDLKLVLQQALRILQAMIDFASSKKWLQTTLKMLLILQMIIQGSWLDDSPFRILGDIPKEICLKMEDSWRNSDLSNYDLTLVHILEAFRNKYEEFMDFVYNFTDAGVVKKVEKALKSLPNLTVTLKLIESESGKEIWINPKQMDPISIDAGKGYYVSIELSKDKISTEAFAPRYTKAKDECWNVILGCKNTDHLISIKRISPFKRSTAIKFDFEHTPNKGGFYSLTVFVMSDCYLGLDQEYSFSIQS